MVESSSQTTSIDTSGSPRHFHIAVVTNGSSNDRIDIPQNCAEVRIGRHPSNHVQLTHSTVSRAHAVLFVEGQQLFVKDIGSKHGTRVRDGTQQLEPHRPVAVANGERLLIGDVAIEVTYT